MERTWRDVGIVCVAWTLVIVGAVGIAIACASDDEGPKGSGEAGEGEAGTPSGIDTAACFGCGDQRCAAEAEACNALGSNCTDLVSCWLECGTDTTCVTACDTSRIGPEDLLKLSSYLTCIGLNCTAECTPDVAGVTTGAEGGTSAGPGADPTGDPSADPTTSATSSTGVPCSQDGTVRGACNEGTLEVCQEGTWYTGECAGCGIVTPENVCSRITAFTLQEVGDELVGVPEAQTTFTQAADAVTAEWYLEASQMGVIQLVASQGIDPSRVQITSGGTSIEFVTLELDGGVSGCQYVVQANGRLARYQQIGLDADGFEIVEWAGCWGDWNGLYDTTEPTSATFLNVRTPVSATNQLLRLTLMNILL